MLKLTMLATALMLPAAPALAESLFDTHREVSMPAGKMTKLYRPISNNDCRTIARHHQAGKTGMLTPAVEARCSTELALRDQPNRRTR